MAIDFDTLFEEVILHEGVALTDDPDDRGGLTKFGISKVANPDIDVENLELEDAKKIYKERYWDKFKIGKMPEEFRRDVFMNVVNSGSAFIQDMQTSLGVAVDGAVGPQTLGALRKHKGTDLSSALFDAQVSRYIRIAKNDPSQRKYLNGWMNRVVGAEPGEVFAGGKIDLRNLGEKEIRSKVDAIYTQRQVIKPDPAPTTPPAPQMPPMGFTENFMAMFEEVLNRRQELREEPVQADTEVRLGESEDAAAERGAVSQFTEAEEALISAAVSTPMEDKPAEEEVEWTLAEQNLLERATGTVETAPPVYAEPREMGDDSKDPVYGIF